MNIRKTLIAIMLLITTTTSIFFGIENNNLKKSERSQNRIQTENINQLSQIINQLNEENTNLTNKIKKIESDKKESLKIVNELEEKNNNLKLQVNNLEKNVEDIKEEDTQKEQNKKEEETAIKNNKQDKKAQSKVTRQKNSLTIKGKNYPIIVGGQNEVDMMGEEFVNVGYYHAQIHEGTGVKNKTHGDGKSIYLAVESKGIGYIMYDTKELEFTDINGDTETYVLIGLSPTMYSNGKDTPAPDDIWETYAGRSGDLIAIQTCDPDSNDRGKAHAYYFVRK